MFSHLPFENISNGCGSVLNVQFRVRSGNDGSCAGWVNRPRLQCSLFKQVAAVSLLVFRRLRFLLGSESPKVLQATPHGSGRPLYNMCQFMVLLCLRQSLKEELSDEEAKQQKRCDEQQQNRSRSQSQQKSLSQPTGAISMHPPATTTPLTASRSQTPTK